jgi:hypothetical protein
MSTARATGHPGLVHVLVLTGGSLPTVCLKIKTTFAYSGFSLLPLRRS